MTAYECKLCGYKSNTKAKMREHIEKAHYKNASGRIRFAYHNGGGWDYWFIDTGIILLKMAPRWAWWVTFFAILIIIAIFTGRFGGAVFGVIAGGIASWIVDDLWTNRIRARNKALSIEEVIADSRNTLLTWS
ncbi:MAG: C2H2-type zinc finger protein, partial [Thermoplasmata archaeon]